MITRIRIWLAAAAAFVAAFGIAWLRGNQSAKTSAKINNLEDDIKTRKRMNEVSRDDNADSARDWLRKRGE